MGNRTESCGRCGVTTVLDAAEGDESDSAASNPFDGPRIELSDRSVRRAAFLSVWLGRIAERLDGIAYRLMYR